MISIQSQDVSCTPSQAGYVEMEYRCLPGFAHPGASRLQSSMRHVVYGSCCVFILIFSIDIGEILFYLNLTTFHFGDERSSLMLVG